MSNLLSSNLFRLQKRQIENACSNQVPVLRQLCALSLKFFPGLLQQSTKDGAEGEGDQNGALAAERMADTAAHG